MGRDFDIITRRALLSADSQMIVGEKNQKLFLRILHTLKQIYISHSQLFVLLLHFCILMSRIMFWLQDTDISCTLSECNGLAQNM